MKIKDILGEDGDITIQGISGDKAKLSNGTEIDAKTLTPDTAHPGQFKMPEMDPNAIKPGAVVNTDTSESQDEDDHPGHKHYNDWMNSEYAPHDDDSGDDNKVHMKAIHFLHSRGVHPGDIEFHAAHLAHKFHNSGIDEESGVYPSRNPGTPAAADAAAQASAPQQPHQSVMPSRNAPTQEAHHDLISQGNHDVGGDATDRFIDQIRDKKWEKANRGSSSQANRSPLSENDPLAKMLTIAGLR